MVAIIAAINRMASVKTQVADLSDMEGSEHILVEADIRAPFQPMPSRNLSPKFGVKILARPRFFFIRPLHLAPSTTAHPYISCEGMASSLNEDASATGDLDDAEIEKLASQSLAQAGAEFDEYDDVSDDDEMSPGAHQTTRSKLGALAVTPVPDDGDHR
jgi:hypothetical protein